MSEAISFFSVQLALIAVVLVMHTYIGLHVIRRGIIFCDLALDQLAALGALVGIALGVRYGTPASYMVSLLAVLIGSLLLAVVKPKNPLIPQEGVIGIVYALALVASLMFADKLRGGGAYVTKTLAGCMLWVTWPLVCVTVITYIGLLLFHYKFRGKFIALTEKREGVAHENLWDFFFFSSLAIIAVLIVPIAGVLLAYGFLMIPAAIAAMFTKGWAQGVKIGWTVGFTACVIGVLCSYFLNLPYGPSLTLALGLFFICALIIRVICNYSEERVQL